MKQGQCGMTVREDDLSEHDREELRKFKHYLAIQAAKRDAPTEVHAVLGAIEHVLYPEGLDG